jgi:hypothetical protein
MPRLGGQPCLKWKLGNQQSSCNVGLACLADPGRLDLADSHV